jgi:hypothetical protein
MKLQEQISRIHSMMGLVETKMNARLRRRVKHLDDEVESVILLIYGPKIVCSYKRFGLFYHGVAGL